MGTPEPPGPPPQQDRVSVWVGLLKGLTLSNVLVLAALAAVAVPVFVIYRALEDDKIMDRLMSTYEEIGNQQSGCAVRHVQERGGPDLWGHQRRVRLSGSRPLVRQRGADPRPQWRGDRELL